MGDVPWLTTMPPSGVMVTGSADVLPRSSWKADSPRRIWALSGSVERRSAVLVPLMGMDAAAACPTGQFSQLTTCQSWPEAKARFPRTQLTNSS
ncbi:hypothetical protein DBR42_25040 [Pelomonas sp. HMWF004]|nr:hypothetical protein DBR42_25040 [Pelomonas sp. HMWF004]